MTSVIAIRAAHEYRQLELECKTGQQRFHLTVRVCEQCWLVSLDDVVPPSWLFPDCAFFFSHRDTWMGHAMRRSPRRQVAWIWVPKSYRRWRSRADAPVAPGGHMALEGPSGSVNCPQHATLRF